MDVDFELCRYERFRHNEQQDSAELLRCLLDGIRKEEIQVLYTSCCVDLPV